MCLSVYLSVCVSVWYCGWCWPLSVRHACSLSVCLCMSLSVRLSLSCIVDVICIWFVTCRCLACYYVYSAVTACLPVHPSVYCVGYMTVCQGQGHADPKVAKMSDFKVISSVSMRAIKNAKTVNCASPRQYLDSVQTYFWYLSSFGITRPSNFCHFGIFKWRYLWNVWSDIVFNSRIQFLGMEDQLDLFAVAPNPTLPPAAIFDISNDSISGTGRLIDFRVSFKGRVFGVDSLNGAISGSIKSNMSAMTWLDINKSLAMSSFAKLLQSLHLSRHSEVMRRRPSFPSIRQSIHPISSCVVIWIAHRFVLPNFTSCHWVHSLCLDYFVLRVRFICLCLHCFVLYIICMYVHACCIIVTRWGEPG